MLKMAKSINRDGKSGPSMPLAQSSSRSRQSSSRASLASRVGPSVAAGLVLVCTRWIAGCLEGGLRTSRGEAPRYGQTALALSSPAKGENVVISVPEDEGGIPRRGRARARSRMRRSGCEPTWIICRWRTRPRSCRAPATGAEWDGKGNSAKASVRVRLRRLVRRLC
jgi:hypothetical protein